MIWTKGKLTSGICSTRRRLYENTPRTVMPTITIVAKTGFLIDVLVIHICLRPGQPVQLAPPGEADVAFCDDVGALTRAGAPSLRLSKRAASTGRPGGSEFLSSTMPL